jgi:hypothetical protein
MSFLIIIGLCLFAYFILYERAFIMYYRYFYYKSLGIPTIGFPLPVIGNALKMLDFMSNRSIYTRASFVGLYNH